ncbi:putative 5-formyltetrahydrofolate cyclo-ligase family [Leishmania utingensis]|uniref:5-formyltetrahydrofolate cyclo-ligase n=1 Tax=Leishmania utingensis TaxID=653362 RepID=A0AAW3AHG0_9TRYP
MQSLPTAHVKKVLRKEQLLRLRRWAKSDPAQVVTASQQICDHVYGYILARYRPGATAAARETSSSLPLGAAAGPDAPLPAPLSPPPLLVLAYLPLYFEVDLVPLMQRLWSIAHEQNIHILTPVVLPEAMAALPTAGAVPALSVKPTAQPGSSALSNPLPVALPAPHALKSAMVFVEVLDERDLATGFAPQGGYGIREFNISLLEPWLLGPLHTSRFGTLAPLHSPSTLGGVRGDDEDGHVVRSCCHGRQRHMILCDAYARLFPESHAAGYRPSGLLEYGDVSEGSSTRLSPRVHGEDTHSLCSLDKASMLVLTPGVLFDVSTGARLGKGGGFYDRFLSYHGSAHYNRFPADSLPPRIGAQEEEGAAVGMEAVVDALPLSPCGVSFPKWEVMGLAFDDQVLHPSAASTYVPVSTDSDSSMPSRIPVDTHDQLMHFVVSPSCGIEQVWQYK